MTTSAVTELRVHGSAKDANAALAEGWRLLAIESETWVARLPAKDQARETPEPERAGNWYVRKRLTYVVGREAVRGPASD